MTSPTLELQGAIVARLKAQGVAGGRVYDPVPDGATFPYVSIGPADELQDDADCIYGVEVTMQVDVWSRAPGFREMSEVADDVRAALHDYGVTLTTNAPVFLEHRLTRRFRDPDGITSHAAMDFRAIIETTAPDSPA